MKLAIEACGVLQVLVDVDTDHEVERRVIDRNPSGASPEHRLSQQRLHLVDLFGFVIDPGPTTAMRSQMVI